MELLEYIEGTDKEEIFETGRNQVITFSCKMQEDKSGKIFKENWVSGLKTFTVEYIRDNKL